MRNALVLIASAFVVCGCSTTVERTENFITVGEGLRLVMEGLDSIADHDPAKINGLMPSEVTVSFHITAGQKDGASSSVQIVPAGIIGEIPAIGGNWTTEFTESTGNVLTIKFRSIAFATDKELVSTEAPEDLTERYKKLREHWNVSR